jgi:benzoate/toluate 1,2-dioxygenase beta subunit
VELRVPDLGPAGESAATGTDIGEISRWIFREARHADDHDYDGWEALWTDDGVYWVPAAGPRDDPAATMSIIYDNRTRISTRIKQLNTGRRHSQRPVSSLRRVVSNLEVVGSHAGDLPTLSFLI